MVPNDVAAVVVVLCVGVVTVALVHIARRARRTGTAGRALAAAMAAYDQAMHVTAFEAHAEVRREDERGALGAVPGRPWASGAIDTPMRSQDSGPRLRPAR